MSARKASPGASLLAALLAAACGGPSGGPAQPPVRPNVVVLMLDTLRPDHLELLGHERVTAPFLAQLGQRSVVFPNAFSTSSKTSPATASLFTGTYPTRHGVTQGLEVTEASVERMRELGVEALEVRVLPGDLATLPELVRAAGYRTYGVAANDNIDADLGFARGFDRFEGAAWIDADATIELLEPLAREILADDSPYFLYLHFIDPHHPYEQHAPWYRPGEPEVEDLRAGYESEIRYLDQRLERLYERFGWGQDTLLVVVSDHGEEFLDHGRYGHRLSLYDELNRVLLLIAGLPGDGRRVEANVSLVDVLPTLAQLLGLPVPEQAQGVSLVPWIEDPTAAPGGEGRTLFAHRSRLDGELHLWAAIRGSWKLIQVDDHPPALFDLQRDPREQEDVAALHPEVAAGLERELDGFRADAFRAPGASRAVELDEELLEQIRALGYVEDD